jgi:hypothetical protein
MAQLPVDARLVHTTPSHPIPTGHADVPGALDWATSHDAVTVAGDLQVL